MSRSWTDNARLVQMAYNDRRLRSTGDALYWTLKIVTAVTGVVSAVAWHIHMNLRVKPRIEEDFADTLDRFSQLVQREYERPWTKRRYGYYEPPSALRRKRLKMRKLMSRSDSLNPRIDIATQLRRTGPTNAAGR